MQTFMFILKIWKIEYNIQLKMLGKDEQNQFRQFVGGSNNDRHGYQWKNGKEVTKIKKTGEFFQILIKQSYDQIDSIKK